MKEKRKEKNEEMNEEMQEEYTLSGAGFSGKGVFKNWRASLRDALTYDPKGRAKFR